MLAPSGSRTGYSTFFGNVCQDIQLLAILSLRCGFIPHYIRSIEIPGGLLYFFRPTVPYGLAYAGHNRVTKWLYRDETDALIYGGGNRTALHEAAFRGCVPEVQQLLRTGVDLSHRDSHGWTALHEAASGGHEMVVQLLLAEGANPSAQDNDQRTALHEAAFKGHDAVSQTLLENGANHSFQDSQGRTPLHLAAYGGHTAVVIRLLGNGADFSCQDCDRQTALQLAVFRGHRAVSQVLRERSDQGVCPGGWSSLESSRPRTQKNALPDALPLHELYTSFSNDDKSSISVTMAGSTYEDLVLGDEGGGEGGEGEAGEHEKIPYPFEGEDCDDELSSSHASLWGDAEFEYFGGGVAEGKGKGKRMAAMLPIDPKNQDFHTKRVKKNSQCSGQDAEGRKEPIDQFSTHIPLGDQSRPYGCPYFKDNVWEYQDCMVWNNPSIDKVREHCRRVHLKPLQCLNCGSYRAGDNGEMSKHHLFESCERVAKITPIDNCDVEKGQYLEREDLSWKEIYRTLFPECSEKNIPSPYWEGPVKVSTDHSLNQELLQTHASTTQRISEELDSFLEYLQGQYPRLFHEFQIQRGFQSPRQAHS